MADLLEWCKVIIQDMRSMISRKVFYSIQCHDLITKCDATIHAFEEVVDQGWNLSLQDLYRIMLKAKALVHNCSRDDWWHGAIMQLDMKEAFREILFELECCFETMCVLKHEPKNVKTNIAFYPTTMDNVLTDRVSNKDTLLAISLNMELKSEIRELAKYVVEEMTFLQGAEGCELESNVFPETSNIAVKDLLGSGACGSVYHASWFGLVDCAIKTLNNNDYVTNEQVKKNFDKEACILGGLSHPNVVKLMCCGMWENEGKQQRFLGMEKMEMDLFKFLKDNPLKGPLITRHLVAIDMMLQIAKGMSYLHDMKVAHRDLKPGNILLTPIVIPNQVGEGYATVKLVDFGISKTETTHDIPLMPTGGNIGTIKYMAPEVFHFIEKGEPLMPINPFKADVYSFGILCYDILHVDNPVEGQCRPKPRSEIYEAIKKGERPILPIDTPAELISLIKDCWAFDAPKRPTFPTICKTLQQLRNNLLRESSMTTYATLMKVLSHLLIDMSNFFWKFIMVVVNWFHIFKKCPTTKETYEVVDIVGVENKVRDIAQLLQKMVVVGIVGMGGIGKTTLARAVSNHLSCNFDATCWINNLQNRGDDELTKEIIEELLQKCREQFGFMDLKDGQAKLKEAFELKRILVIMDDAQNISQISTLIKLMLVDNKTTNRIIVTTRDLTILEGFAKKIIKVDCLHEDDAKKLFHIHALKNENSFPPHLEEVAEKIIKCCKGFPLSLKLTGSYLFEKERLRVWEQTLQRLQRARPLDGNDKDEDLWKRLRISFDGLELDDEKNLFLDICHFFGKSNLLSKGMSMREAIRISQFNKQFFETLTAKSLVQTNDLEDMIEIHDQLRDMGRMIVEKDDEFCGTRFLNSYAINAYIQKVKILQTMRGVFFNGFETDNVLKRIIDIGITELPNLRYVQFHDFTNFNTMLAVVELSKNLKWLHMDFTQHAQHINYNDHHGDALWHVINNCHLQQLRVLEIHNLQDLYSLPNHLNDMRSLQSIHFANCTNLQSLPQDFGTLPILEFLGLQNCKSLKKIPNTFTNLTKLETLFFDGCEKLQEVPVEFGNLCALKILSFNNCKSFKRVPDSFTKLRNLKELSLLGCGNLVGLPMEFGDLRALELLDLQKCTRLEKLPDSLTKLTKLEKLSFNGCEKLQEVPVEFGNLCALELLNLGKCTRLDKLPDSLTKLTKLVTLYLSGCEKLQEVPVEFGNLCALEILTFQNCKSLERVPDSFTKLQSLKKLSLQACGNLVGLLVEFGDLHALEHLDLENCTGLKKLPDSLTKLTKLEELYFNGCEKLEEVHVQFGNLCALKILSFDNCKSLKRVPDSFTKLQSLKKLSLEGCGNLVGLPVEFGNLSALKFLNLGNCTRLVKLPDSLTNLTKLETLYLNGCEKLQEVPVEFGNLCALEIFSFQNYKSLERVPDSFTKLRSLKELTLHGCGNLVGLPVEFGDLRALEHLDLGNCTGLKKLPDSLTKLTKLEELSFHGCEKLEEVPMEFGNLCALEILSFQNCKSLKRVPDSFTKLQSLKKLSLQGCGNLVGLPMEFGDLRALEYLDLENCTRLEKLPDSFTNLTKLETLYLNGCEKLQEVPVKFGNLCASNHDISWGESGMAQGDLLDHSLAKVAT